MAEALGTAVGVISLGLQLYAGLSEYLEAVKGRDEDLQQAKNYAKTLQCSLKAIEDAMNKVNGDNTMAQDAVEECTSSCLIELKALDVLLKDLKGEPALPSDTVAKARSSIRKWSYPFRKNSMNKLEERLKSANNVLKTALSALQLAILNDQSTAIFTLQQTIETISQRMSSPPESKIDEILTHLRNTETAKMQVSQLVSYPQDLQILCDAVSNLALSSQPRSKMPKLQGVRHGNQCPLAQVTPSTQETRNAIGVSLPNILGILTNAVGVSLSLTTGAGGLSLAQNITWAATVDENTSPSFKLIKVLCDMRDFKEPSLNTEHYDMIAKSCVRRLHLCYAKHQASPSDKNKDGESVLDVFAGLNRYRRLLKRSGDDLAFVFRSLAAIEVPITYDRKGQMDVNYCGQSPVHVAVLVGNLRLISLVIQDINPDTLNTKDSRQRHPIDYAVSHLRGRYKKDDQQPCVSCSMVELLLESKAVLYEEALKEGLISPCQRTRTAILQHLAQRRKELEQLAISSLSAADLQRLDLCKGWILDRNAHEVQNCLADRSWDVPKHLTAHSDSCRTESLCSAKSVYTYILDKETAVYALALGFNRETAFIDVFRRIVRAIIRRGGLSRLSSRYIDWILEDGYDLTTIVPTDFMPGVAKRATWAHYLMSAMGYKARWGPYRRCDMELPQSVAVSAFSPDLRDDCRCYCSSQGCTPLIKFLEGLGCRRRYPRTTYTITEAIRSFVVSVQDLIAKEDDTYSWMPRAVLRYATFTALGLRHTCCKHANGGLCYELDSEEIDEIHDEDSATIQLLEDLVTDFGNGYGSMATVDTFLKEVWLPRMKEVYRDMISYRLSDGELRKAEDCGVKLEVKPILWCDLPNKKVDVDPPEGFDEYNPLGLEGWMRRLDTIATDPERPAFVTP
ncbi:hypothetical protein FBEOM_12092 [Fusarium beomiforme]|uniref:Fungal N-terminal domain-containing protein n=1 Tax=Fusarium beomiforme TaxID=44412 RepID=A0A9P5A8T9_9HYPO|nr:hypothetical protein FBEOM_12092 [Fusarium beomiforme]